MTTEFNSSFFERFISTVELRFVLQVTFNKKTRELENTHLPFWMPFCNQKKLKSLQQVENLFLSHISIDEGQSQLNECPSFLNLPQ